MASNNNFTDEKHLFSMVFSELKALGVKVPKIKKLKSTVSKQEIAISEKDCKVFGVSLGEQEWTSEAEYPLPKFLVLTTVYLQKFIKKEVGLFRKAGNIARQRNLRAKVERGEGFQDTDPNDVACLLKQWLRELPESLIPGYLQDLFIRCNCLEVEKDRVSACLFTILLLPPDHMYTLKHLLRFLFSISLYSDTNKMRIHNLALVMSPNIFVTNESAEKMKDLLSDYTDILNLLIENSDKIGEAPPSNFQQTLLGADLHNSIDTLDFGPGKYKRKMSGPVQDILCGFKKLVGHGGSLLNLKNSNEEHFLHTPKVPRQTLSLVNLDSPDFVTPKEKGETVKLEKRSGAHARRKSFGALFLRKKERKKLESESSLSLSELVVKKLDKEKSLPSSEYSKNISTITDSCPRFNDLKLNSSVVGKDDSSCLKNLKETRNRQIRDTSDSVIKSVVSIDKPAVKYSKSCVRHVEKESETFKTPLPPSKRNSLKLKTEKRKDKSEGKFGLSRQEAFSIKNIQHKSFSKEIENRNKNKENIYMKTGQPENYTCSHSQNYACNTKCDKNKSGDCEKISERRIKQEICTQSRTQSHKKKTKTTIQNSVKVSHAASVTAISPNLPETLGLEDCSENMVSPSLDLSLKLLLQNFCVSPPNGSSEIKVSIGIEASNSNPELKLNISKKETPGSDNQNSTLKLQTAQSSEQSATKTRSRLSSQSDSKIPRLKNLSRPNRPNSFSGSVKQSGDRTLRSSNERSKRHSTKIPNIQVSCDSAKESVKVQHNSCFESPNSTSEVWIDGSSIYFSPIESPSEEIFNKRESVAKILKENPGNVQAKVGLYNRQQGECFENKLMRAASEKYPRKYYANKLKLCASRSLSLNQDKDHEKKFQSQRKLFLELPKSMHKELYTQSKTNL